MIFRQIVTLPHRQQINGFHCGRRIHISAVLDPQDAEITSLRLVDIGFLFVEVQIGEQYAADSKAKPPRPGGQEKSDEHWDAEDAGVVDRGVPTFDAAPAETKEFHELYQTAFWAQVPP